MAPRADYSEDWQLQCGEIKQRGAHLLKSEQWSDCSFLVGQENEEQVVIKAHKLILAMASPVFEAMFYGPIAEGNSCISIPDIQPETFRRLLEYIYTDNIELDSTSSACNLYYGAQKYMLPHLMTVCSTYLTCNLTVDIACQTYEFALMVGEENLIKDCEKLIRTETLSILSKKEYLESSIDTLEKVFAMETLNISSELDLFKAAESYAKALNQNVAASIEQIMEIHSITEEKDVQAKSDSEINSEDIGHTINNENEIEECVKMTIDYDQLPEHDYCQPSSSKNQDQEIDNHSKVLVRNLVKQIRFLTLTPAELAEYPTLTSLLTESEILAVMMNIASTNTHIPMPEGFSLSRTKR